MLAKDGKKACSKCKTIKDTSEYNKCKSKKDGLNDTCKVCFSQYRNEYNKKNKERLALLRKLYRENNKEKVSEQRKLNYKKNKEAVAVSMKKYQQSEKGKKALAKAAHKAYLKNPIKFRVENAIKKALHCSIRGQSILEALGYTIEDLKCHLESRFSEGMSWDNYGEWHIDHIIPQSWLPFETLEDENFLKCWSLCNLQPLWAKDNCSKGNRYTG
jgi:hypothetical protein